MSLVQRYNPHVTELLPSFRRTSLIEKPDPPRAPADASLDNGAAPPDPKLWQYIPRVCAYEPPRTRPPPSSPVLAYREVVEHPHLTPSRVEAIRALLAASRDEKERKANWQENAVPLPDTREEEHKAADLDVSSMIMICIHRL